MRTLLAFFLLAVFISCRKDAPKEDVIVMLGDSMTKRGDWSRLTGKNTVNLGIDGLKSPGVLNATLPKAIQLNPDFIYLMIGVNDANTQGYKSDNYEAVITAICDTLESKKIAFAIQSVLPSTISFTISDPPVLKQAVDTMNTFLTDLCAARKIPFIDVRSVLTTPAGYLDEAYSSDGLHLNEAGYAAWATMLR